MHFLQNARSDLEIVPKRNCFLAFTKLNLILFIKSSKILSNALLHIERSLIVLMLPNNKIHCWNYSYFKIEYLIFKNVSWNASPDLAIVPKRKNAVNTQQLFSCFYKVKSNLFKK